MSKIDPRLDFVRSLADEVMREAETREDRESRAMANALPGMVAAVPMEGGDETGVRVQVLIELEDPSQASAVPGVYPRSRVGNILTAEVTLDAIAALENDPNVLYVERGGPISLTEGLPSSTAEIEIPSGPLDETGKGVIVGIIDWGCDFTHGDFRSEDGSRILYFWDQAAPLRTAPRPPFGYRIGAEFSKAELDRALQSSDPYAALGIQPPDVRAHGTHVMGIAVGNGQEDPSKQVRGLAPEADIIFVQPNTGDVDVLGGFGDSVNLAEAVKYVFDIATELGRPAVVNLSMGTNYGPHDGTTLVEQWIDRLLGVPGRAVVLAMGNEHQERFLRIHAEGRLTTGETTALYWRVLASDITPNEVEIWYSGRDIFILEVVLPSGETVEIVEPGEQAIFGVGHAGTRVYVSNQLHSPLNGDNSINVIVVSPEQTPVEAGVWQLRLTARVAREGTFDAWIERDERQPVNLQSSFVGGSYVRRKTLGSIQSARHAIPVSNYDAMTITLADSTSVGPTRDGRRAPVVAAPGVDILSANARYREAERPEDRTPYYRATGTSMSSPYVAGVVACMLQKNPKLTATQIKGLLAASARPAPGFSPDYRIDWGHGRVDPIGTLARTPAAVVPAPLPIEPAATAPEKTSESASIPR
jgi:subtilisin family serine protease